MSLICLQRDRLNKSPDPKSIIGKLMKRYNNHCCYCEREVFYNKPPYATVEHAISKANGGKNNFENLKLSCHSCNFMKSTNNEDLFIQELYNLAEAVMRKKERMEKREKEGKDGKARKGSVLTRGTNGR